MVNPWKSAIHAVKWTTGIKSLTGRVKVDELAVNEAQVVETQEWQADLDQPFKWTKMPPLAQAQGGGSSSLDLAHYPPGAHDTSSAAFTFENGGASDVFPTDSAYLARLSEGFSFPAKTAWKALEWTELSTQPTVDGRAATRVRQRKWIRQLDFTEPSMSHITNPPILDATPDARTPKAVHAVSLQTKNANSVNASNTANTMAALGLTPIAKNGFDPPSPVPAPRYRTESTMSEGTSGGSGKQPTSPTSPSTSTSTCKTEPALPDRGSSLLSPTSSAVSNSLDAPRPAGSAGTGVDTSAPTSVNIECYNTTYDGTTEFVPEDPVDNKMHKSYDVIDTRIALIGKQILKLEHESVKWFEEQKNTWKKEQLPVIEEQVKELEARLEKLKVRLGEELDIAGIEHAKMLENEIAAHSESLEAVKRNKYFPNSKVTLGAEGYYIAFDDLWLEHLVGCIAFDLQPSKTAPFIRLFLAGDEGPAAAEGRGDIQDSDDPIQQAKADDVPNAARKGLEVRFKLEKFMTNGDKGTSIPKISLDTIKITLELRVEMKLVYDVKTETWQCSKDQLLIELLSFRGPFGTRKSMIAALLPIIKPQIRHALIKALPKELGSFVSTLPSPFELRGGFSIKGTPLQVLKDEMGMHEYIRNACNLSALQMGMFKSMHTTMGRTGWTKSLSSVSDVLTYIAKHKRNGKLWRSICALWEEACELYCEQVLAKKRDEAQILGQHVNTKTFSFKFANILHGALEVARKKIHIQVSILKLEGQASLNKTLRYFTQFLYRTTCEAGSAELKIAREDKASPRKGKDKEVSLLASSVKRAKTILLLSKINNHYENGLQAIKMMCRNFDFLETRVAFKGTTGIHGALDCVITKLFTQFPLLLDSGFNQDKQIWGTLVPFKIGVRPQATGDVKIELAHVLGLNTSDPSASSKEDMKDVTVLGISARKPHISIIVDQKSTLKPGAELFSLMIGPRTSGKKKPFGAPDMMQDTVMREETYRTGALQPLFASDSEFAEYASLLEDDTESKQDPFALELTMDNVKSLAELYADESPEKKAVRKQSFHEIMMKNGPNNADRDENAEVTDCPLFLQTAPGIKMLVQIPEVDVHLSFPSMMKFLAAHFKNLPALKDWLEDTFGGKFVEEQLALYQTVLVCIAKYLIMPGMSAEMNLSIKVITQACEIIIRMQTPESMVAVDEEALRSAREESPEPSKPKIQSDEFAISRARAGREDILDDRGSLETETNQCSMYTRGSLETQNNQGSIYMRESLAVEPCSSSKAGPGKQPSSTVTAEEMARASSFFQEEQGGELDENDDTSSVVTTSSTHTTTSSVKNAISFDTEIVIDQSKHKREGSFVNAALISSAQSAVYIPKSKGKRPKSTGSMYSSLSETSSSHGNGYKESSASKLSAANEHSEMASVAESEPSSQTESIRDREKDVRTGPLCAMKLNIAFNVMDLVDDSIAISTAMSEAKSAATENAIEQAEKLLRRQQEHENAVRKHMDGER